MPWQLTTPVDVGSLDVANYDQLKIVRMTHVASGAQRVEVQIEYGRTVDNQWVRGMDPVGKTTYFIISGADYDNLVTHISNDSELTYEAVKRGLYEWLSANGHIDAGAIV